MDYQPSENLIYKLPTIEAGPIESFEDSNDIETINQPKPIDLSNDIYVNQLMADAGALTNPDAEVFDIIDARTVYKYSPNFKTERLTEYYR